jgi:hypothetical protein
MPTADKEAATIEPWAAAIGLALLVIVTGVTIFTAWDRMRNGALEEVVTPTAVGDMHFVPEPSGGAGSVGLQYKGRKLDMAGAAKLRDSKLIRVGMDDTGVYTLYRLEEEKQEGAHPEQLYLKIGVNEFMRVTPE